LRFAIKDFLDALSTLRPGEVEPAPVVEHRRMQAHTILGLLGDEVSDDIEMMALSALAWAAVAICDQPEDPDVVVQFESGEFCSQLARL
jgi:hypothetical protein